MKLLAAEWPTIAKSYDERKVIMLRRLRMISVALTTIMLLLTGCSGKKEVNSIITGGAAVIEGNTAESSALASGENVSIKFETESDIVQKAGPFGSSTVIVDTEFSARDMNADHDDSLATHITFNGINVNIDGEGAVASEGIVTITEEGAYVLSGNLTDGRLIVDAGKQDKIQLVFQGLEINCSNNAPVYIKKADKVFITLTKATVNSLTDGMEYVNEDLDKVDAVIFSRADLTLNGTGQLNITGNYKHGIVSKDDLVITGGIYHISAVKDVISGKDSVKIKDGTFLLSSMTGDGIESKNDEDNTRGYVYICGGSIKITKCRDGIDSKVIAIAGGIIV